MRRVGWLVVSPKDRGWLHHIERERITFFWGENNKYRIKDNEKNIQNKRYSCKHQIIRTMLCNRIT